MVRCLVLDSCLWRFLLFNIMLIVLIHWMLCISWIYSSYLFHQSTIMYCLRLDSNQHPYVLFVILNFFNYKHQLKCNFKLKYNLTIKLLVWVISEEIESCVTEVTDVCSTIELRRLTDIASFCIVYGYHFVHFAQKVESNHLAVKPPRIWSPSSTPVKFIHALSHSSSLTGLEPAIFPLGGGHLIH